MMEQKIILMGPPGAGKGTVSELLIEKENFPHIAPGDIFRDHIAEKDEIGLQIAPYVNNGKLIPGHLADEIIKNKLLGKDIKNKFILDGYPRELSQAKYLSEYCNIDKLVIIKIADNEIVSRLSGRRVCPHCGASYHIELNPPKHRNICDHCDTKLIVRDDESKIRERLKLYHKTTEPLIEFFKKRGAKLIYVDGNFDLHTEGDKVVSKIVE